MKRVGFFTRYDRTALARWCIENSIPIMWYFPTTREYQKYRYWGRKVVYLEGDMSPDNVRLSYMVREIDFPIVKLYLGDAELIYEKS